jgi:hypothetical protein
VEKQSRFLPRRAEALRGLAAMAILGFMPLLASILLRPGWLRLWYSLS